MRKGFFLLAFLSVAHFCFAAEKYYPVQDIPEHLKENAVAVVRLHEYRIKKENIGFSCEEKWAITIMNESGKELAYLYESYDKNSRVDKISAVMYDAEGERTRKIKSDEILDVSEIGSGSLYTDSRAKVCYPEQNIYPFTIEYIVTTSYKSAIGYPTWYLLPDYKVSFQKGSYELKAKSSDKLSYTLQNSDAEPSIQDDGEDRTYRWEIGSIPAVKYEPYSKGLIEMSPYLEIKPDEFTYNGFSGTQNSWNEFGQWSYELIKGRQELSAEAANEVKNAVKDCTTERQKVHEVYKFMQNRVRYVNIAEGIGGLQPIEAQRVHDVGYGDCKALSNYVKALLEVVGIEAVYTKILAGPSAPEVNLDFPTQQSNHVILTVPLEEDSIWLECTSLRMPPDYVGTFTDDRTVLFVTEEGGIIGRTPSYSMDDNELKNIAFLDLDENLNAKIHIERYYSGIYFGGKYSNIFGLDEEDQKREIMSSFDLSGFDILSFEYDYHIDDNPFYVKERIDLNDDAIVVKTGDYVLFPLNIVSNKAGIPERTRNRAQGMFFRRSSVVIDTVMINIPSNLEIYQLPEDQLVESDFGRYVSSVQKTDDGLLFIRRIEYFKGDFPAERYRDYYDYCKEKSRADGQQVMLKLK